MLIKLILLILIFYWGGKLVKDLLSPPRPRQEVKGQPKSNKPLDLSGKDVEDADFEEIDD